MPRKSVVASGDFTKFTYLTVPEVMLMTGLSRKLVTKRIADGDYKSITDGERTKVLTSSILKTEGEHAA